MRRSPSSTADDRIQVDDPPVESVTANIGRTGIPARVSSAIARRSFAIFVGAAIAGALVIAAAVFGRNWFEHTRSDAYQIERIAAEAEALLPELEGMDVSCRGFAMLALVKDADWALSRANQIGNPYFQIQVLRRVAATLTSAGITDRAETVRREFISRARVLEKSASDLPDPSQRMTTLQAIAVALAEAGTAEATREAAELTANAALAIENQDTRSGALASLATELAAYGKTDEAKKCALLIAQPAQQADALIGIASILKRTGPSDQGREFESLAVTAALDARTSALRAEDKRNSRGWNLHLIALKLFQADRFDRARETALLIEDPDMRARTFNSLANLVAKKGDLARAREAATQAKESAFRIADPQLRWSQLHTVVSLLAQFGESDQAREAAILLEKTVLQIKQAPASRVWNLDSTSSLLAEVGLTEQAAAINRLAVYTADQIHDAAGQSQMRMWHRESVNRTIRRLARDGAYDRAEEAALSARDAALQLEDPREYPAIIKNLVLTVADCGLTETARKMAIEIKDPQLRWEALTAIGEILSRSGQEDRARETQLLSSQAASRIEHPISRSNSLLSIAANLAEHDRPDEAGPIAEAIPNPVSRSAGLAATAKALARKRRVRDARIVAESCSQPSDRLDAFIIILGEHLRMRRGELAAAIDDIAGQPARTMPMPDRPTKIE